MMDASPVILTNAITKSFRHVQALRGVSVRVDRGKITAVVGDNGSGKSTLIKILSGSHRPDSGSICIDGKDYSALSIRQSMDLGIRTVYQDLSLDDCKNSFENVFLGGERMKGLFLEESHSALNILRTLRDKGLTQIIVSHNLAQVFDLADFVYVMRSGEVIASAATKDITPEDLRELILYS